MEVELKQQAAGYRGGMGLAAAALKTEFTNWLLDQQGLTTHQLNKARQLAQGSDSSLHRALVELGLIDEISATRALADLAQIALFEDHGAPDLPVMVERLSSRFLRSVSALPLKVSDGTIVIAIANPFDEFAIRSIGLATGLAVRCQMATYTQIERHIDQIYDMGENVLAEIVDAIDEDDVDLGGSIQQLKDMASEAPVVRLVNLIVNQALELGASDIHIEPFEKKISVRHRVDGVLHEAESPPFSSRAAITSRIKIMAKLDIAENRLPQDGRIQLRTQGKDIDIRVSTLPTLYGESVALRILDKNELSLDFSALGFSRSSQKFVEALDNPQGILLVTGPTGSGKTTTLYTALNQLNQVDRKIITVEDPVEYQLPGINQTQVKPAIGVTFANALRAIVRQDPDIIMIGEMRDQETAGIAVQAALTGHLVLSTLHTNNAGASITRLLDMGVKDYLLVSTISGIFAQRLVRCLCTHCSVDYRPPLKLVAKLGLSKATLELIKQASRQGCQRCNGTGYRGRTVIGEFMAIDNEMREFILGHQDGNAIQNRAMSNGMINLFEDGLKKVEQGVTSIDEVLRVTQVH